MNQHDDTTTEEATVPAEEEGKLQAQEEGKEMDETWREEREEMEKTIQAQAKRIDDLARAYADALNERESFRKRLERENERQLLTAKGEVAEALLDAAEELRRAIESETGDAGALQEGVRLIADELIRRLEQMGISRIETKGVPFDPLLHEAVDLVMTDDPEEDGKIVGESRAGWKMGERIIRAARVVVARRPPPQEPPAT